MEINLCTLLILQHPSTLVKIMSEFRINEQSRLFYDADETHAHAINSERPLRYRMVDHTHISQNKYMEYPNSLQHIDTNSSLRARPTRLNEGDHDHTMLYGTAPLMARNAGPVDVESSLLHGHVGSAGGGSCVKPVVAEYTYFDNIVKHPVPILPVVVEQSTRGGVSTRNVYKNTNLLNA